MVVESHRHGQQLEGALFDNGSTRLLHKKIRQQRERLPSNAEHEQQRRLWYAHAERNERVLV